MMKTTVALALLILVLFVSISPIVAARHEGRPEWCHWVTKTPVIVSVSQNGEVILWQTMFWVCRAEK
jgi:hypothetical protein